MNCKIVRICLLLQIFIFTSRSSWVKLMGLCESTKYCHHVANLTDSGLICKYQCRGDNARGEQLIQVRIYSSQLNVECKEYKKPHYLEWITNLTNIEAAEDVNEFNIKDCPLPNVPYSEILHAFKTKPIKTLELVRMRARTDSASPAFGQYHFANISSSVTNLKIIQSEGITELPENLFSDLINLEVLSLFSNELQTLPVKIFEPLRNLKHLSLQRNSFTFLEEDLFKPLFNLETLQLEDNKLGSLPIDIFSSQSKLEYLSLKNNEITTLRKGTFDGLKNLHHLNLDNNKITTLHKGTFDGLKNLRYLSLEVNQLTDLPEELFVNNSNLMIICMWKALNPLKSTLPPGFFAGLTSLQILDLSSNNLTVLPQELFQGTNLEELLLDENRLSLSQNQFRRLVKLKNLSIQENQLKNFDMESFSIPSSLKKLDLSYNKLVSFKGPCLNLTTLILTNNSFTEIAYDWKYKCSSVENFNLSNNQIKSLKTNDLNFIPSIGSKTCTVDLSSNKIEHIDLDLAELLTYQDPSRPNIVEFIIKNNFIDCSCRAVNLSKYIRDSSDKNIRISPDGALCGTPNQLHDIPLENVKLETLKCQIDKNCPKNGNNNCSCYYRSVDQTIEVNCTSTGIHKFPTQLPNATDTSSKPRYELYFAKNGMNSIEELEILSSRYNISGLNVSFNKLETIENIRWPRELKFLCLNNNNLPELSYESIDSLQKIPNLTTIELYENPWNCNCDTRHLSNFIRYPGGGKNTTSLFPSLQNIRCKNNNSIISDLTEETLCYEQPPSNIIYIVCSVLGLFGFAVGILIVLYFKYEYAIRAWMFAHPWFRWIVTEKEFDKDKLFDAFVSFCHKDINFIEKELVPTLEEGEPKYKLCLHYRDFLPGEFIPHQVAKSVENSRRTIIVLTRNFLESVWGQMEFRAAHVQATKERCARVIIIMLEDVTKHEKMDPELKAYITWNTYIEWGDPLFWEKLKYVLPHPQGNTRQRDSNFVPLREARGIKKEMLSELEKFLKNGA